MLSIRALIFYLLLLTSVTCFSAESRFLLVKHPTTDAGFIQMNYPNARTCSAYLAIIQADKNNPLASLSSCNESSYGSNLPYRATLRYKAYNFVVDLEAISLDECTAVVDSAVATGAAEVVVECKPK